MRLLSPVELYGTFREIFGEAVPQELKWSHKHRVLLGFGNDNDILLNSNSYGVSNHLVMEWVARKLSEQIVLDLDREPADRIVLRIAQEQDEDSAREQLHYWWVSLLSQWSDEDSEQIDRLMVLFRDAGGVENPESSWPLVLEAILRHPRAILK